jgi:CRP-like cAMP-binding protein
MSRDDLKRFACFSDLGEEECDAFSEACREITLERGDEVFVAGEEADGLLLLVEGRLGVEGPRGRVAEVGPGAELGALSLIVPGAREVGVTALEACRVLWLARTAFRRLAEDTPHGALRFVERVLTDLVAAVRPELARWLDATVDPPSGDE